MSMYITLNLKLYVSENGDLFGDTWHQTLEDAIEAALEKFGVREDQWQTID
jgi:hypothetical protein